MDLKICFTSTQNTFAWSNACHYNPQLTWNNWSVREETVPRHSAFHMDDGPSPISWGKHAMDMSLKHLSGTLGFLLRWIQNWRSLIKHRKSSAVCRVCHHLTIHYIFHLAWPFTNWYILIIFWHPLKVTSWGIKKCRTTRVFVEKKHGDFSIHLFPGFLAGPVKIWSEKSAIKVYFPPKKKSSVIEAFHYFQICSFDSPWFIHQFANFGAWLDHQNTQSVPWLPPRTPNLEPRWPKKTVAMVYACQTRNCSNIQTPSKTLHFFKRKALHTWRSSRFLCVSKSRKPKTPSPFPFNKPFHLFGPSCQVAVDLGNSSLSHCSCVWYNFRWKSSHCLALPWGN